MHLNTFPAVHLRKMDIWDQALKFSTEFMVVFLGLVVAGLNLFFFRHGAAMADKSPASKLLAYHYNLNPKLYYKNTATRTVVAKAGLIAQAQAEDFIGSGSEAAAQDGSVDSSGSSNSNILWQPTQDSIDSLLAKQIKVYTVQPGDSLKALSARFDISAQTIIWANNLPDSVIKPGFQLIILPVNGILHKATSNDTLPDIAKKYSVDINTIIAYNGLASAEDIEPGQLIIVPGGVMPAPPKPKPVPRSTSGKVNGNGVTAPKQYDSGDGHIFPWGYCTWYVATKVTIPWGGNAKNWLANARAMGYTTSKVPKIGSVVVTNDSARYGHVAYVESMDGDSITVSEMNYEKFGKVNYRTIPKGSSSIKGYIYAN